MGFRDQSSFALQQTVRLGCVSSDGFGGLIPIPCRPGERVSAFANGFGEDVHTSMVLGGQGIPSCDAGRRPSEGTLCVAARVTRLSWVGSAPLPPFAGAPPGHPVPFGVPADILNVTTVPGTFGVFDVGATIWQSGPGTAPRPIDGIGFNIDGIGFNGEFDPDPIGPGPAQFVLEWQPDTGTWLPLFAEGRIDVLAPTPEPTTFLLFATTAAAGLGLVRRYRRRGYAHAA
jgi:hypothetical protein